MRLPKIKILLIALSLVVVISQAQVHADTVEEHPAPTLQNIGLEKDSTENPKSDGDYWRKALRRYDFSIINDPEVRFLSFFKHALTFIDGATRHLTAMTQPMLSRLAKIGN